MKKQIRIQRRDAPVEFESAFYHIIGWSVLCLEKVDAGIITSKVKTALLGDPNVKSFDIAVVTRDDEVLLTGFVDNQTQVDRAMEVARGIEGVRLVRNEMSIKK